MTVSREQIDRALPNAMAWPSISADLTDPKERAVAVEWLYGIYQRAASTTVRNRWAPPLPTQHESQIPVRNGPRLGFLNHRGRPAGGVAESLDAAIACARWANGS